MIEFKVGDRVKCIKSFMMREEAVGKFGIIKYITDKSQERVGIEFDEFIEGHDGWGRGKDGYYWEFKDAFKKKYLVLQDDITINETEIEKFL